MKEKSKTMQPILWLGVAAVLSFLAGGDTPVELAVWLSPVFWLRFFWMSRPLKGFLFAFKNKLIFILPDGNIAWEHMKARLVPGVEDSTFLPGDGILKTTDVPVVPVGHVTGAICYDPDFPQLIRQAGRSGSSLLLAPANDWPAIKHMHATMARTRAIENGLAVIRPTSGGISIAVDPYGRIVSQVDYFQSRGAALDAVLPVKPVATLYSSLGDLFAWIVLIGTLFLLIGGMIRSKRQNK